MNNTAITLPAVAVLSMMLIGCGGEASKKNATPVTPEQSSQRPGLTSDLQTGQFVDSPVAGIHYKTETLSGFTDAQGYFNYKPDESVTFSIGNIVLGKGKAGALITPSSLVNTHKIDINQLKEQNPSAFKAATVNILRLLQTIDKDADPSNGIQIDPRLHQAALAIPVGSINVQQAIDGFAKNQTLGLLLGQFSNTSGLVSSEHAIKHFQQTLSNLAAHSKN